MSARHTARSIVPAAILALVVVVVGAGIPAATRAQGDSTAPAAPHRDPSSDELREIVVLVPRLMRPFGIASAPNDSNRLEEVTVRGRPSLSAYRLEVIAARERIWDVFNEINSDDRFDIACSRKSRTGTRMTRRVCRPQYADYATSEAGRDFVRRVQLSCPPGPSGAPDPVCVEAAYATGTAEAQRYIGEIAHMDRRLDEEAQRLARENPQLAIAILDYQSKQREYEQARQRRRR